jgi:hypothetical protein
MSLFPERSFDGWAIERRRGARRSLRLRRSLKLLGFEIAAGLFAVALIAQNQ